MKKLSFYEQVGILVPGAALVFGMLFQFPSVQTLMGKEGITIGGLGVFVILAYALGHLLAALGSPIEKALWFFAGGMPSNWILEADKKLLSAEQAARVLSLVRDRFSLPVSDLEALQVGDWHPIFRQIYADVESNGRPARGDIFNGNYGLNRGLCAAALVLTCATLLNPPINWILVAGLAIVCFGYLYRMYTFGIHYAREIYSQFLLLPSERAAIKRPRAGKKVAEKAAE